MWKHPQPGRSKIDLFGTPLRLRRPTCPIFGRTPHIVSQLKGRSILNILSNFHPFF